MNEVDLGFAQVKRLSKGKYKVRYFHRVGEKRLWKTFRIEYSRSNNGPAKFSVAMVSDAKQAHGLGDHDHGDLGACSFPVNFSVEWGARGERTVLSACLQLEIEASDGKELS